MRWSHACLRCGQFLPCSWLEIAHPATALSKLRSQREMGLGPGLPAAHPSFSLPPLRLRQLRCFLQVASQRAGWKMPVLLTLCLLQGESQTQPRFRACRTSPEPRAFQAAEIPGRPSGAFRALAAVWTYLWLSLRGSKAMQWIREVVRSMA